MTNAQGPTWESAAVQARGEPTRASAAETSGRASGPGRASAARTTLVAALLGFFMISLDATAVNVALPAMYFQRVLGEPAITAGLLFLPMTALLAAANLASTWVAARFGHQVPVRAGLAVSALGMLALAFLHGGLLVAADLVPVGTGLGFALPSLTFVLLEAIPADQAGLAGGLFNASRKTGGALAVALFGALVSGSFGAGMHASLLISAALLVASLAAALTVLRGHPA